mmetsp:Transcript_39111/g.108659  ORF Transcript_39111/g.108659 Transcript_39111/m.108659 type:complete len:207 (-) Transcript_39111:87-707(-)
MAMPPGMMMPPMPRMATLPTVGVMMDKEELDSKVWEKWPLVYPCYLNSKRTTAEGRKVPLSHCVAEPNCKEISEVLVKLSLKHVAEQSKRHPRDFFGWGRVRVCLWDEAGKPLSEAVPTRKALWLHLGKEIPLLESRIKREGEAAKIAAAEAEAKAKEEAAAAAGMAAQPSGGAGGGSGGGGGGSAAAPKASKKSGNKKKGRKAKF